jgi:hypothetical protein
MESTLPSSKHTEQGQPWQTKPKVSFVVRGIFPFSTVRQSRETIAGKWLAIRPESIQLYDR